MGLEIKELRDHYGPSLGKKYNDITLPKLNILVDEYNEKVNTFTDGDEQYEFIREIDKEIKKALNG